MEYRRGIKKGVWQKLWHFHEGCEDYPARNFEVRTLKPPSDELCGRCGSLRGS